MPDSTVKPDHHVSSTAHSVQDNDLRMGKIRRYTNLDQLSILDAFSGHFVYQAKTRISRATDKRAPKSRLYLNAYAENHNGHTAEE